MNARGPRALILLTSMFLLAASDPVEAPRGPRLGFFPQSIPGQARGEAAFLATPTPRRAEEWLRRLTEEPHVAGTPNDRELADLVRDRLKEFGFETTLATYPVLLNYPLRVSLRLEEPEPRELSLFEAGEPRDKDSYSRDAFPAFHGYGASGKASAQVVYVNYGTDADFRRLEELGVSIRGRIALIRYGRSFRGLKVYEAQRRGAAGVILYSDPADDGYMKGDVYPDGPMRPPSALQRGSVQFLSLGPGDPQTPGYASTPGARRIPRDKLEGIPKIPSLPIGYGEAEKILRALAGTRVPDDWQGGLPFAYHLGPGPAKLAMEVEMDYAVRPIWNVIGKLAGATEPERWVILGNHRDAWTYGAVDPNSGTTSFLEAARGIGEAVKAGWKPRRTLILASWDAEEYGLVGSTEWGEDLARELSERAVAYVNLDSSVTGPDFELAAVPSLRDLALEAADDLPDPLRVRPIGQLWRSRARTKWNDSEPVCLDGPEPAFDPMPAPLGSGSDYTVFLDHLGIASMSFGFSGPYGVYHSTLDDFFWMKHFGDPNFLYHTVAARYYGLLAMRLSGADLVPLRYRPYATALERQMTELRREAARESRKAVGAEKPPDHPPLAADFGPLLSGLARFRRAAEGLDARLDARAAGGAGADIAGLNDAVVAVERQFLTPEGIGNRPWFRHVIYAPGLTAGYDSWPYPGLTQAIQEHDPALWERESRKVRERLQAATAALERAAELAR